MGGAILWGEVRMASPRAIFATNRDIDETISSEFEVRLTTY